MDASTDVGRVKVKPTFDPVTRFSQRSATIAECRAQVEWRLQYHEHIPGFYDLRYGLVTLTVVPLLSPSESWLSADRYVAVGCVMSTALNVMLPIFFGIAAFDSLHWPSRLVVHDPVRPLLQDPLTKAPASGVCPPPWMVTVTTAVQAVC